MKTKKILISTFFALMLIFSGIVNYQSKTHKNKLSKLQSENVEALSGGETIMQLCDKYCYSCPGYRCVLETNSGFEIRCEQSKPKSSL